ncbi:MAG: hypothetical protein JSS27_09190 [Planctomycetes bacterium]|nr:hypothetical protein [Planctomycetota bacterium]
MRPTHDSLPVLNRLLAIEYRSLPMYLMDARPWRHTGDQREVQALCDIITNQKSYVQRLSDLILSRAGALRFGEFPMEYTALHDLALDYLLGQLVQHQFGVVAEVEQLAERLGNDRPARELALELLGSEKAHLETLQELASHASSWMA